MGICLDIFTLLYLFSPLCPSLWETARYRLKHCPKRPLDPKQQNNQRTFYKTNLQTLIAWNFVSFYWTPGPEVIKLFSCSTQLSMKFFSLIYVKMPTIVGILTCMSGKNNILGLIKP